MLFDKIEIGVTSVNTGAVISYVISRVVNTFPFPTLSCMEPALIVIVTGPSAGELISKA